MSKLVRWGRWVVGACFVALSVAALWETLSVGFTNMRANPEAPYTLIVRAAGFAISAFCAWGILKLRLWGHVLALTISILAILLDALLMIAYQNFVLNAGQLVGLAAPVAIATWLLAPSVRAAYWGSKEAA